MADDDKRPIFALTSLVGVSPGNYNSRLEHTIAAPPPARCGNTHRPAVCNATIYSERDLATQKSTIWKTCSLWLIPSKGSRQPRLFLTPNTEVLGAPLPEIGAPLPTPWLFEPAKCLDDWWEWCIGETASVVFRNSFPFQIGFKGDQGTF